MNLFFAALLASMPAAASADDACNSQVSRSLTIQVEKSYPSFRLPAVTDNLPVDVEWDIAQGGNGCLGVARGDFDGNGRRDILLALTEAAGEGAIFLVALSLTGTWELHELAAWPKGRSGLYVTTDKPGTYVSVLDPPLPVGEVRRLACDHPVAVLGATEASGAAYCYKQGAWQLAWFSD